MVLTMSYSSFVDVPEDCIPAPEVKLSMSLMRRYIDRKVFKRSSTSGDTSGSSGTSTSVFPEIDVRKVLLG